VYPMKVIPETYLMKVIPGVGTVLCLVLAINYSVFKILFT
jgi:hypothetical protein